jgi:hypothetical protein
MAKERKKKRSLASEAMVPLISTRSVLSAALRVVIWTGWANHLDSHTLSCLDHNDRLFLVFLFISSLGVTALGTRSGTESQFRKLAL